MCPVVYAFESSVSSQNDFHLKNWKAMIVEISLPQFTVLRFIQRSVGD